MENIISKYLTLCEELKKLEAQKSEIRDMIFAIMDEQKSDVISLGDYKAKRQLIVQKRLDSKLVEALIGDEIENCKKECEVIQLKVM